MLLLVALAALVITEAGTASELAWLGASTAAAVAGRGDSRAERPPPVYAAVAALGLMLLLRHDTRLAGPALRRRVLLMDDLAIRTMELNGVGQIAPDVIFARVGATLAAAAIGARVSVIAALAVTAALPRSALLTAVGALAAVAAFVAIVLLARWQFGPSAAEPRLSPPRRLLKRPVT